MPKQESSFLYFLLEGHDNLCFYSTIPHEIGEMSREVEVFTAIEFQNDMDRLWDSLKVPLSLEVKENQIVSDS